MSSALENTKEFNGRTMVVIGCIVLLVGGLDYLTGPKVPFWPAYLLPVGMGALLLDKSGALIFAVISALTLVSIRVDENALSAWTHDFYWAIAVFAILFTGFSLATAYVHDLLVKGFS